MLIRRRMVLLCGVSKGFMRAFKAIGLLMSDITTWPQVSGFREQIFSIFSNVKTETTK